MSQKDEMFFRTFALILGALVVFTVFILAIANLYSPETDHSNDPLVLAERVRAIEPVGRSRVATAEAASETVASEAASETVASDKDDSSSVAHMAVESDIDQYFFKLLMGSEYGSRIERLILEMDAENRLVRDVIDFETSKYDQKWFPQTELEVVPVTGKDLPPGLNEIAEEKKVLARVFVGYGTNRKWNGKRFTAEISQNNSQGFVDVSIPRGHNPGRIERPVERLIFPDEIEDAAKHVVIRQIGLVTMKEFQEYLSKTSPKDVLVFVHGFNVTFEAAAMRTAQLHHDLRFQGQSFFYSWASDGEKSGYVNDSTKIADSVEDIANFVEVLSGHNGVESVFMIGHSMGSRGLTRALSKIGDKLSLPTQAKFRELILVEPDISQSIFKNRIAPGLLELGARVTIYASENDNALGISKPVNNGEPRLGQAGEYLFVRTGFDTVDSSDVGLSFFSLNHSEYAENIEFIHELVGVIDGKPAQYRPGITKRDDHWYLYPGGK